MEARALPAYGLQINPLGSPMAQIVVVSLPYFAVVAAFFYFFVQRMH
jgi:hypothetical protein